MYKNIGKIDAVVVTTGKVAFAALTEMSAQQYAVGLQSKLMGQVNLVLQGLEYLNHGGSLLLSMCASDFKNKDDECDILLRNGKPSLILRNLFLAKYFG